MRRAFPIFKFKMMVIGCGLTLGGLPVRTQVSPPPSAEAKLPSIQFEVAAIKPHSQDASMNGGWRFSEDSFSTTNLPLKTLIFIAYNLRSGEQLQGLPKWGGADRWDIQAKIDGEAVPELRTLGRGQRTEEHRLLLRDLLARRFGLKVHHETRKLPIYELVVAKSGLKLKAAAASDKGGGWSWGNGTFKGTDVGVDALSYSLSSIDDVGRMVENKTGLTSRYDIEMKWTPQGKQEAADSGPSIFTALEEQLGLKLVSAKGPVDVIVVDHVEQPSPN